MALYSATASNMDSEFLKDPFSKQVLWFFSGIMLASIVVLIPPKMLNRSAYWFYCISLVLLVTVLLTSGQKGVHRWLIAGPIHFQPSEVAKIATLLALARYLASGPCNLHRSKDVCIAFCIVILPMLLILKEPDLGTAVVLFGMILPVLFWAGLSPFLVFLLVSPVMIVISAFKIYTFAVAILAVVSVLLFSKRRPIVLSSVLILNIAVGVMTPKLWDRLHDYQKIRIMTFIGLQQDPRGTGYQVTQSQVAIGSGGFEGKGWLHGTQTKLRFLPEQHTDFIFSVLGEEFGFMGVTVLLGIFYLLLWRSLRIASEVKNKFMMIIVVGSVTFLATHIIINIGMTVGMMPVVGLPLPFLSYGGSALWANMVLVGFILNAGIRRFQY